MFNFSENFRLPRFHLPLGRTRPKVLERDGGGNTGKYILQKYKRAVWLNDAGHHSVAADAQKRLLPKAPNHTTSPPPPRYVCEYVRCTVVDHTHHRLTQTAGLLASAVAHKPPSEPAYHYDTRGSRSRRSRCLVVSLCRLPAYLAVVPVAREANIGKDPPPPQPKPWRAQRVACLHFARSSLRLSAIFAPTPPAAYACPRPSAVSEMHPPPAASASARALCGSGRALESGLCGLCWRVRRARYDTVANQRSFCWTWDGGCMGG